MKNEKDTESLFHQELQALWSAESMLVEAMPRMIGRARNEGLKNLLRYHLAETDQHKVALEMICKQLEVDPKGNFNAALQAILDEGDRNLTKDSRDELADGALIAAAQKIERFEMKSYELAAMHADMLGLEGICSRLRLTFAEEEQANAKLYFAAKHVIDSTAMFEKAEL